MEDKLREDLGEILIQYCVDSIEAEGQPLVRRGKRGLAVDQILDLFQQHKREWLESILPEKDNPRLGSENQDIYVAYSDGFNSCLDEIREKGGLK